MKRRGLFLVCMVAALVAASVGNASGQGAQTARVVMDDFRFGLPNGGSLPEGRTRITFVNRGEFQHNFTIVATSEDATGRRAITSRTLEGGQRQRKTVNLRPGAYVAVCTVFNGGHIAQGMVTEFTVGELNRENGTWE